jgi:translation initiation factor 2 beta subunit (eIF-2beta)/eIF-5
MQMSREGCRMRERRRRLMIVMRNAIQVMEVMMSAKGDKYRIRQRSLEVVMTWNLEFILLFGDIVQYSMYSNGSLIHK